MFCTKCGTNVKEGAGFCTTCGNPMNMGGGMQNQAPQMKAPTQAPGKAPVMPPQGASVCPNCGNVRMEGKPFCTKCGYQFDKGVVSGASAQPAAPQQAQAPQMQKPVQPQQAPQMQKPVQPQQPPQQMQRPAQPPQGKPPVQNGNTCPTCGKVCEQGASFCTGCGYKFGTPTQKMMQAPQQPPQAPQQMQKPVQPPQPQQQMQKPVQPPQAPQMQKPVQPPQPQQQVQMPVQPSQAQQVPNQMPQMQPEKKEKSGKGGKIALLIILIVVVLLLAGGAVWYFFFGGDQVINDLFNHGGSTEQEYPAPEDNPAVAGPQVDTTFNPDTQSANVDVPEETSGGLTAEQQATLEYILSHTGENEMLETLIEFAEEEHVGPEIADELLEYYNKFEAQVNENVNNFYNNSTSVGWYTEIRSELDYVLDFARRIENCGIHESLPVPALATTIDEDYKQRFIDEFCYQADTTMNDNGVVSRSCLWNAVDGLDDSGLFDMYDMNDPLHVCYNIGLALHVDSELDAMGSDADKVSYLYKMIPETDYNPLLIYYLAALGDTNAGNCLSEIEAWVIPDYSAYGDISSMRNYLYLDYRNNTWARDEIRNIAQGYF